MSFVEYLVQGCSRPKISLNQGNYGSAEPKLNPNQPNFAHMQGNIRRTYPRYWFNNSLIRGLHGNNHGSMGRQKYENEPNLPPTHPRDASQTVQGRCRWNGGRIGPGWGSAELHVLRLSVFYRHAHREIPPRW
jgi:hypothetical protein